tara:strand:+ start:6259 stop:9105 length:2847 start_codon:yes stop_codon:yes gene_type:complete
MATVLDRSMFGGTPPPAPAEGTGITSGLMPEAPPMGDPAMGGAPMGGAPMGNPAMENSSDQVSADALNMLADTAGRINSAVDGSEDFESMMNALRGNQRPVEDRRAELAELVGEEDANQTPESVLTILQPTFTIMETVQENSPSGGIGDLPVSETDQSVGLAGADGGMFDETAVGPMGAPPVNFPDASSVQAPGTGEAIARIQAGEQPVAANDGLSVNTGFLQKALGNLRNTDENNPNASGESGNNPLVMNRFIPNQSPNFPYLQAESGPGINLQNMDLNQVRKTYGDMVGLVTPFIDKPENETAILKRYQALTKPYLPTEKTPQQLYDERQAFMGTAEDDALGTQAALALAAYGSKVAQGTGSLLQALTVPAGDLAADLSKVAAAKSKRELDAKEKALSSSRELTEKLRTTNMATASAALTAALQGENNYNKAIASTAATLFGSAVNFTAKQVSIANDATKTAYQASQKFAALPPFNMGEVDKNGNLVTKDGKLQFAAVTRFKDKKQYKDGDTWKDVPGNWVVLPDSLLSSIAATNAKGVYGKTQKADLLVPTAFGAATDPTAADAVQKSPTGYREVAGFYSPTQNRYFYYPDGDQTKPAKVAPAGFLQGKLASILEVQQPDNAGRTKVVVKGGVNQGKSFFSKIQVPVLIDPTDPSKGTVLRDISTPPNPYAAVPMQIKTVTGSGGATRRVIEGDPISRTVGRSLVPPEQMSAASINERQRRVVAFDSLLRQSGSVLAAIPNVVGPMSSVKSFMTNWIAPLIPGGKDDFGVFVKTAAGQQTFENFARSVRLALTLSPRFPVAEQNVTARMAIDQYNKDGDHQRFFKSVFGTMTKFHEFVRFSANELSRERAQLLGTPWQERMRVPTGSKDDAFNFETRGHLAYLMKAKGIAAKPFSVFMSARAKTVREKMYPNASTAQLRKLGIGPNTEPDALITFKINSNELGSP